MGLIEVLKGQFLEDKTQGKIWKGEGWWQGRGLRVKLIEPYITQILQSSPKESFQNQREAPKLLQRGSHTSARHVTQRQAAGWLTQDILLQACSVTEVLLEARESHRHVPTESKWHLNGFLPSQPSFHQEQVLESMM